jgi:hypothetical protein
LWSDGNAVGNGTSQQLIDRWQMFTFEMQFYQAVRVVAATDEF